MTHEAAHPLAGKTVILKDVSLDPRGMILPGSEFVVRDWVDRLGKSWRFEENFATAHYANRAAVNLPLDDEVVYGHIGRLGHCVHNSELGE